MTNLKVLGVTQTYLFGTTSQVTQIVVHNESTGQPFVIRRAMPKARRTSRLELDYDCDCDCNVAS